MQQIYGNTIVLENLTENCELAEVRAVLYYILRGRQNIFIHLPSALLQQLCYTTQLRLWMRSQSERAGERALGRKGP